MTPRRSFFSCACIVALMVYKATQLTYAHSVTKHWGYELQKQDSYLPFVPNRLGSTSWRNVTSPLACARQSLSKFRASRGFLYNPGSGACRPLLWLQGPDAPGAQQLQPEEGDMYLFSGLCGDEFTIMELGTSGDLACLKYVKQSYVPMAEAASHCQALASHLVHVKTRGKLELIRNLVSDPVWVGFEYLRSVGIYVWKGDNKLLTSQEIQDVFLAGEPNDLFGKEGCGEFSVLFQLLNDVQCDRNYNYICEMDLPVLDD